MLNVYRVWLDNEPGYAIAELAGRELHRFPLVPYRDLQPERDFKPYVGQHPRKTSSTPLPDPLYALYGLERSQEAMTEVIRVRVTPAERTGLEKYARKERVTVSDVIREYISTLI